MVGSFRMQSGTFKESTSDAFGSLKTIWAIHQNRRRVKNWQTLHVSAAIFSAHNSYH